MRLHRWLGLFFLMLGIGAVRIAEAAVPYLNAADYGVVADGVTPADAALAAALLACGTMGGAGVGGTLLMPAGQILLTGSQSIKLADCNVVGQNVINADSRANGTTILLTSTTTPPFVVGSSWSIHGVNFYWPQQTSGTSVYPPLFVDDGAHDPNYWRLDHVNIVNAYDGFVATGARSWGGWMISDSYLYAVHDLFRIGVIADTGQMSNVQLEPGTWLGLCHFACADAVNAADSNNTIFHATGSDAIKAAGNIDAIYVANVVAVGWRYGFKIDNQGAINSSKLELVGDGVGTYIDTSAGGMVAATNMSCLGGCSAAKPSFGGSKDTSNYPAFNLGREGRLILRNFTLGGGRGTFITSAGASVSLDNVRVEAYGGVADGGDYYAIDITGNNGTELTVRNSDFSAGPSTHVHGIRKHVAISTTQIQNSKFEYLNDALDLTANDGSPLIITGNYVGATQGSSSFLTSGGTGILYDNNVFDKPPIAHVSGCGVGASVVGGIAGQIHVGAANGPVRFCGLTLPWMPAGAGNGNCIFSSALGISLAAAPRGIPPTWTIAASADMASTQIRYSCRGQQ